MHGLSPKISTNAKFLLIQRKNLTPYQSRTNQCHNDLPEEHSSSQSIELEIKEGFLDRNIDLPSDSVPEDLLMDSNTLEVHDVAIASNSFIAYKEEYGNNLEVASKETSYIDRNLPDSPIPKRRRLDYDHNLSFIDECYTRQKPGFLVSNGLGHLGNEGFTKRDEKEQSVSSNTIFDDAISDITCVESSTPLNNNNISIDIEEELDKIAAPVKIPRQNISKEANKMDVVTTSKFKIISHNDQLDMTSEDEASGAAGGEIKTITQSNGKVIPDFGIANGKLQYKKVVTSWLANTTPDVIEYGFIDNGVEDNSAENGVSGVHTEEEEFATDIEQLSADEIDDEYDLSEVSESSANESTDDDDCRLTEGVLPSDDELSEWNHQSRGEEDFSDSDIEPEAHPKKPNLVILEHKRIIFNEDNQVIINDELCKNPIPDPGMLIQDIKPSSFYNCGCGRSFTSFLQYKEHETTDSCSQPPNVCNICDLFWSDLPSLVTHLIQVHQKQYDDEYINAIKVKNYMLELPKDLGQYDCKKCGRKFDRLAAYTMHTVSMHSENFDLTTNGDFACKLCAERTLIKQHMVEHVSQNHVNTCKICKKGFNDKSSLAVHVSNDHQMINQYVCETCNGLFSNFNDLRRHVLSNICKMEICTCEDCQEVFIDMDALKNHMLSVHHKADVTCDLCGRAMQSVEHKITHMECDHTSRFDMTSEGWFKCKTCEGTSASKALMLTHVARNHENKFSCSICGISFRGKASVANHFKKAHPPEAFVCPFCNYNFDLHSEFEKHSRTKCGAQLPCAYCDAVLNCAESLNEHIKTHQNEGIFCDICGKQFKRQADFFNHNKHLHTEYFDLICTGDFLCKVCQMILNTKKNIVEHICTTHEDVIKFMCTTCGQTFINDELFTLHTEMGHVQELFICGDCGKNFRKRHTFAKHRKRPCNNAALTCRTCRLTFKNEPDFQVHVLETHK